MKIMKKISEHKIKLLIQESLKEHATLIIREEIVKDIKSAGEKFMKKGKEMYDVAKKGSFSIETKDHKITFLSTPYETSASNAEKIFNGLNGKSETSSFGRKWIRDNIYLPICQEKHGKTKKAQKWAKYFSEQLGGEKESYWSSWTFGNCYKTDDDYKKLMNSFNGSADFPLAYYPTGGAKSNLMKIMKSPESYLGKTLYCLFDSKDAPVYKGDGLFFDRSGSQNSYESISTGKAKPSHMRILIDDSGTAIGGNESQTSKKIKHDLKDNKANNATYSGKNCIAVFKKVMIGNVEKINK